MAGSEGGNGENGEKGEGDKTNEGQRLDTPVYEMFWDCAYCGAKKLLGVTHRHCPSCGAAQNPDARYFPAESEKVAVKDHIYFGADWACQSCQTPNSSRAEFCGNCGTPKDPSRKVTLAHQRPAPPPKKAPAAAPAAAADEPEPKKSGGKGCFFLGCAGAVIAALVLFCAVAMLWTRAETATITSHTWARTIAVEEVQATRGESWCTETPSKAYDVRESRKEKETKKVADGETCTTKNVDNGDGSFRQEEVCSPRYRDEPVYAQWCNYTIDKWAEITPLHAKGSGLSPEWPAVNINTCILEARGCQREGSRSQTYSLVLKDASGGSHTCEVPEKKWRALTDGTSLEVKKRVIGGGLDCSSL